MGTANNTTIYSNCTVTISSGGVANSTTVNSQGAMHISSGGMANYTMITGDLWYGLGSMTISKGGIAKNTTVGGFMFISSGGTADSTTVISGGNMQISSGGTADSTMVISGGSMHISSGGTATNIITSNGARLWITVASNTYIQGTANGSAFEMKNAQISGYGINSWGTLEVYSGGTADSTTVNSGGVIIYNGGVASNTTVNSGGYISLSGGIHRGTLQIASGATVSAHIYTGGTIDFTVSDRTTEDGYLINDLSLISGTPTYTITVSADQAFGTYKLAQGAENFTNTISIGNGMITYGSITVNGEDFVYNGTTYSLDQVNGNLTLTARGKEKAPAVFIYSSGTLTSSGAVIDNATLANGGNNSMHISSGGTANSTTVNYGGEMNISSGGTANSTTVSRGYMYIRSGGVANSTTVTTEGHMYIFSGGVANSTTHIPAG